MFSLSLPLSRYHSLSLTYAQFNSLGSVRSFILLIICYIARFWALKALYIRQGCIKLIKSDSKDLYCYKMLYLFI